MLVMPGRAEATPSFGRLCPAMTGKAGANLRPFIHSALIFGIGSRELAFPGIAGCRKEDGGRGAIVWTCLAAIYIAKTPDLALSRESHAWLCRRAGDLGCQHGHRLSWIRARLRRRGVLPTQRVGGRSG